MKKILFIFQSCYGNLYPLLEIMSRLEKKNCQMYVYTTKHFFELFKDRKVYCLEDLDIYTKGIKEAKDIYEGNLYRYLFTSTIENINIAHTLSERLCQCIEGIKPDIIIHDCFSINAKMLAAKFNIPAVNVVPSYALNNSIIEKQPRQFYEMFMNEAYDHNKYVQLLSEIQKIEKMLQRKYRYSYSLLEANTCEEDINICFSVEALNYFKGSFGQSYYFVGRPMDARIKKSARSDKNNKVRVYISSGTLYDFPEEFYEKCIKELGNAKYEVIMKVKPDKVDRLRRLAAENIEVSSHVNQKEVLANSDVFLSHGGNNSFYESVASMVPAVYIPVMGDQLLVAKTAKEYGIGRYVPFDRIGDISVREEMEGVLNNPALFNRLTQFRQEIEKITGLHRLDEAIDKICEL